MAWQHVIVLAIYWVCLSSDPFCFSLSSRIRMSEKYAHLARMRELENIKSSFIDAMAYIEDCKKKPQKLKIWVAHLKSAPEDWDEKMFGK